MRRTFADVLRTGMVDIKNEYSKLYELFYDENPKDGRSIAEEISNNFIEFPLRGTCLTFDEFNRIYGFRFERSPREFDEEYLISFCEYVYNLLLHLDDRFFFDKYNRSTLLEHIMLVIEKIGYIKTVDNEYHIFVLRDSVAVSVAQSEIISEDVSYKVIAYNHSTKKGNLEAKKAILIKLAEILEPNKSLLEGINRSFSSDLFMLLNNCNIRHNNVDSALAGKYHKYIAEMSPDELERIYDEIYQMSLLAFMQLEQAERNQWVKDLKNKIVNVK